MKKIKMFSVLWFFGVLTLISCQSDDILSEDQILVDSVISKEYQVSKEALAKISALNFNPKDARLIDIEKLDGTWEKVYLVEGDILIEKNRLDSMEMNQKQYRTNNLVTNYRTVKVLGYTGSGQSLSSRQKEALQNAINNFNDLDIGLDFQLSFGLNPTAYDIVVYQVAGPAGGQAGFPSNGKPYNEVRIFSGIENFNISTIEHVMTHELGHTIGLRHTDWFSRESCGENKEEDNSVGAIHIPGTPTGFDPNSLMLACFNGSESGNFGSADVVAIEYLYPVPNPYVDLKVLDYFYTSQSFNFTWGFTAYNMDGPVEVIGWYGKSEHSPHFYDLRSTRTSAPLILFKDSNGSFYHYMKVIVQDANGVQYERGSSVSTTERATIMALMPPTDPYFRN